MVFALGCGGTSSPGARDGGGGGGAGHADASGDGEASAGSGGAGSGDASDAASGDAREDAPTGCISAPWVGAWPMPNAPSTGAPHPFDYDTSTAGVVVDKVTGLIWQQTVDADTVTQTDAAAYCAALTLAGVSDWRLPTRIELISLIDDTRVGPAIDPTAFPATPGTFFWTSTVVANDPASVWGVAFDNGYTNSSDLGEHYRVRCVRTATPPTPGCYTVMNGTVQDSATGLTWQRDVDATMRTWSDAQAYCAALTLDGGGFRLPRLKELLTMVDETRASPAVDPTAFPNAPASFFWTGSAVAGDAGYVWFLYFDLGETVNDGAATNTYLTRCVR
ncbi:MAG TPA: DUF1566 domain-containing protein [Polyangia bacterium]|nr:DUF1566 domain-containing protein [Polyangia bacterium]